MASDYGDTRDIAQNVLDLGNEEALKALEEVIRPSSEEVRAAAQNLVDFADSLLEKAKSNAKLLERLGKNINDPNLVLSFSNKIVTERLDFVELMRRVLAFQNLSNAYLGQRVQMVYMYIDPKTGSHQLYAIDNDVEEIKQDRASSKKGGFYTGRYNFSKRAMQTMTILTNSKYDSSSLDTTYSEVYRRYQISTAKYKLKGAFYILWQEAGGWDGRLISGLGPVAESYANFFINEYIFNNSIEMNVRDYILNNKYGVVKVDNASGLLQGDISKGVVEFGIKKNSASAMGYTEIVEYAREMLDAADVGDFLTGLKQKLHDEGVENAVSLLESEIINSLDDLASDIEKGLTT